MKRLFIGTVRVNKAYLTGTVPVNKAYLTGTVPVNKTHLTGTLFVSFLRKYYQEPEMTIPSPTESHQQM